MMHDLEFNTGLSARAFAQAKLAQCLTEPGLIVRPGETVNKIEPWKASGVREKNGADGGTIVVWGPPVEGERLDALLNRREQPDAVLAAVSLWIQAVLVLGASPPRGGTLPLWPSTATVALGGEGRSPSVFFAPSALGRLNVTYNDECYMNPALSGMNAAAFTAAVMLYRLFAGDLPFSSAADAVFTLHQDMREGNFLPVRFAIPGLEPRLAALIQSALTPPSVEKPSGAAPAADGGLSEILELIQKSAKTVPAASLVASLPETDRLQMEKEKARYLKIKTTSIKTRRFIARNTALLLGVLAAAAVAVLIVFSVINNRAYRPTTRGMEPVQVIETYYRSFGVLDHQMMEACVTGDAGKNDISTVVNLFVITKSRQAYEYNTQPLIFPAHEWKGGDLPETPMFGAADLRVEPLDNELGARELRYRVEYTFWIPAQAADTAAAADEGEAAADTVSVSYLRSDIVTLVLKKDTWCIAEIARE